ncbi:SpoIIE family protein phosphatase [Marinoscillum sp. 108]|uniref:SpoIIE family protein phosphatase n=1 Tax=Marinoscillum sp. 108 TaxID=2653151 RepID=UPI0012F27245|nr:SpoIIE family protein phosphatase [Marinoscillum sp. 108]VXD19130.1 Serine/threonine protein phosphatase [Marinoscillum sp. 108]
MLSEKLKIRLSFLAGILSWLLFTFFDLYLLFVDQYQLNVDLSAILPQIFLTTLVLSTLSYYRYTITKADSINFIDLLWRVFITGLVTTIGSLFIRLFFYIFGNSTISENPFTVNFLYNILIGLVVVYLVSTFVVWKRLILYQKSKNLIQLWGFFEYALLGSLIFDLFGNKFLSVNFNTALIFLGGLGIILAFNLKWIAYLNFKQKWKSILFIILSGIYLYHFLLNLMNFSETGALNLDLLDRAYFVSLFIFIILYAGISILVTLFNLPTSSVFERKLQEAIDFQKLSQSIPAGQSAEQTYDILLESSMSAVFADAAWLEISGEEPILLTRGVTTLTVKDIKESVRQDFIKKILSQQVSNEFAPSKVIGTLNHPDFKSIIAVPVMVQNEQIGSLALLQEVGDAFNREMVDIITTFVNQASISIENFHLIREALDNERYKEQLKIAKSVQKSLLPSVLERNDCFEIEAYSMAADEVGGDYYDIIEPSKDIFNLIIGDVSGKGTSAAFNMAQMRGIFHSLAQDVSTPKEFITKANSAIGRCLEKNSFITAIFFVINTREKKFCYARAGHCPAMYYSASTGNITLLEKEGLGLGILRNSQYNEYVQEETINYQPGDLLLLYTDGISEAKNEYKKQYGADGLKSSLQNHINAPLGKLKDMLINDLLKFLNGNKLDDDYTLTIVRFK